MMQLKWLTYDEKVMHWSIEGDWTASDYNQTFKNWKNFATNKPYTVDLIMDMRHAGRMPSNMTSLAWQSVLNRPQNLGVTLIVTKSKLLRTVYKSMTQIYGGHDSVIIFSADWDGALEILEAAQSSRAKAP
ncbi:MAG: hypothetical protein Q9P01_03995 [Anaerolineae bacterium]|nr:hypothetical protein [Anaerolineae bacterium]MDQ7034007.1 hypothetical protein [Anaerolineae bacterium]